MPVYRRPESAVITSFDNAGHVTSTGMSSVIGPVAPAAVAVAVYDPARNARTRPAVNETA